MCTIQTLTKEGRKKVASLSSNTLKYDEFVWNLVWKLFNFFFLLLIYLLESVEQNLCVNDFVQLSSLELLHITYADDATMKTLQKSKFWTNPQKYVLPKFSLLFFHHFTNLQKDKSNSCKYFQTVTYWTMPVFNVLPVYNVWIM